MVCVTPAPVLTVSGIGFTVIMGGLAARHCDALVLAHLFDYAAGKTLGVTLYRVRRPVFEVPPPE
ncbi:MAG: hypothetical protein ACREFW_05980 [Rhizomicrobium sp.]